MDEGGGREEMWCETKDMVPNKSMTFRVEGKQKMHLREV